MNSVFFAFAVLGVISLLVAWARQASQHRRRIVAVRHRIHVNGVRGKSSVTRLVAGVLREAGVNTIAKTTGTAAVLIDPAGRERPIERRGAATILEQLAIVRDEVDHQIGALVIECMAVKPSYQVASEQMVRSTIGILTNVREDHQDVMGHTLPEIAASLLSTCPSNGLLITAERDPAILEIIRQHAERRGSRVVVADPAQVSDIDIAAFDHVEFKDNVAIGLAVAEELGVNREIALRGMLGATPDAGVMRVRNATLRGKQVTWANLFAVNDRESTMMAMQRLGSLVPPETTVVGILNNRADREKRAMQFADIATRDLQFDRLAAVGAYQDLVIRRILRNGFPPAGIIRLADPADPSLDEVIDQLMAAPTEHVTLVGLVNVHTAAAELLLEFFDGPPSGGSPSLAVTDRAPEVD